MRTDFETSGDIRDVDLLAAFVGFWRRRSSGAISFSRAAASAAFGLAEGEVASVSSSEARFESSAILVRAGKLDGAALERLSIPEGTDGALAALQTGILTKREWRWGEKIRAIEILADLLAWPDGKYYFDADARPVAGDFTLTIPRLLLELFLRSRDRNLIEHQLGPSNAPLVRSADFDREFSSFGLTADAESVVRLIDGHSSAEEIAQAAPAEDFAVRKLLAALTTLGLVSASAEGAPAGGKIPPGAQATDAPAGADDVLAHGSRTDPDGDEDEDEDEDADGEEVGDEEDADSDVATRRVPTHGIASGPEADREASAREPASDWDVSSFEPPRRGDAFDFDPPGSTTPLEAFPLPAEGRGARNAPTGAAGSSESPYSPDPVYGAYGGPGAEIEPELDSQPGMDSPPADPSERSRTGPGTILGLILAGLVVAIAAVMYFRARPVSSARAGTDTPAPARTVPASARSTSPSPAPALAALEPTAATPPAARAAAAATSVPARRSPAIAPTPARVASVRPSPIPVPTRSAAPVRPPSEAKGIGREDWGARAARDTRRLAGEKTTRYAIQLELACEAPSLADAFQHDRPAGSMWLLATRHGTRDCFRVLWGRYPSLDAAKRAKSGTPPFFSTDRNHPAVVSVR